MRDRYKSYPKTSRFSIGGGIMGELSFFGDMENLARNAEKVESYTVRDLMRFVPGAVSAAVASVYQIRKSEVAACHSYKYEGDGPYTRGRNSRKSAVITSFEGYTLSTLTVRFIGKKHSKWLTKPSKPPKGRRKIKRGGRTYSVPKPYTVTVETFRGKPVPIKPKGKNRVFVVKGKNRAFIATPNSRRPLAHASSSVPQAIENPKSRAIWSKAIAAKARTRFEYHRRRIMGTPFAP